MLDYLDAVFFEGENSIFNILLGYCSFICTHEPPKSFVVAITKSLIYCAKGLNLYQTTASPLRSENNSFKENCDEKVQKVFDQVIYTIGHVAQSLIKID